MYKSIYLFTIIIFFLSGCATDKAFVDEIVLPNGSKGLSIDCLDYGWTGCFVEAGNACENGYKIHERAKTEDIESKIPVEELGEVRHFAAVPIRPHRSAGRYMVISCK